MVSTLNMMVNDVRRYISYNFKKDTRLKNKPHIFVIESTNHCNLDCVMCPRRYMKRKPEHMKFELFKKIIDESKDFVYEVGLDLYGEPLLSPDIFKMIRYAKEVGINNTAMSTNAVLLTEENAKKIFESGLDVLVIDFDAFTKENYEKIRRGAKYETVLKNVKRFAELKTEEEKMGNNKPYTILQIIEMKRTEHEVDRWIDFWKEYPFHLQVKRFNTRAQQHKDITQLSEEWQRVRTNQKRQPCSFLWELMVFGSNGNVSTCCNDYDIKLDLGNVKEQSVLEIWNGEKFRKLRELHKKGIYPSICKNCLEWKGNPKYAFWKEMKFIRTLKIFHIFMEKKVQYV